MNKILNIDKEHLYYTIPNTVWCYKLELPDGSIMNYYIPTYSIKALGEDWAMERALKHVPGTTYPCPDPDNEEK